MVGQSLEWCPKYRYRMFRKEENKPFLESWEVLSKRGRC
jgi:hypothetical protein